MCVCECVCVCAALFKSPWTYHPLQSHSWSNGVRGVVDARLPIRWACPGTPAPAPTGPPHNGQSYFHPEMDTGLCIIKKSLCGGDLAEFDPRNLLRCCRLDGFQRRLRLKKGELERHVYPLQW